VRGRAVVGLLASLTLLGCPNPNTYGTPRTIPPGSGQHTLAVEGLYVNGRAPVVDAGATTIQRVDDGFPMAPTYQYRHGVADTVDFGIRVTNLSGFGADVKWNFVRGVVDLALDPGAQWVYLASSRTGELNAFFLHAPLLVGVNVTRRVAIVVTPGAVVALEAGRSTPAPTRGAIVTSGGVLARLGLGVNVRVGRLFAMMPEVTAMRAFNDTQGVIVVGGLGLKMGAQPRDDDEIAAP
jgi:hypothetical protein